jgi:hypothetical protein
MTDVEGDLEMGDSAPVSAAAPLRPKSPASAKAGGKQQKKKKSKA